MSIAQQIMSDPGKYSIQELQHAMDIGLVPAYIAVPLIQQKTQQQQQLQMAAQGANAPQDESPTVVDDVLSQADQTNGIDVLPTGLPEQGFAPGGIVAFDDGGEVKHFRVGGLDVDPQDYGRYVEEDPELTKTRAGIASLAPYAYADEEQAVEPEGSFAKAVKEIRGAMGNLPSTKESSDALREALRKQAETEESEAKKAEGWRWLELAGAIGSSDQAYNPLAAISQGVKQVAPSFAQDEAARRRAGIERLTALNQLDRQAREEEMAGITGGLTLFGHQADLSAKQAAALASIRRAQIAADKDRNTEGDRAAADIAQTMSWNKYGKPLSELQPKEKDLLMGAAREKVINLRQFGTMYGANLGFQGTQANISSREREGEADRLLRQRDLADRRWNNAMDAVGKELGSARSNLSKESRRLQREFGEDASSTYLENERRQRFNAGLPVEQQMPLLEEWWKPKAAGTAPAAPAAATAPAAPNIANIKGAPAGSTIGKYTPQGWEIRGPGGKLLGYAK